MPKPFLSYDEQLDKLCEKGLSIQNRDDAKTTLRRISYFGLIGGYKLPFKNPTTKKYKDGTTFEDIVAFYKFDENLRELFLKYILQIERHIRSLVSYHFAEKFGAEQSFYLDQTSFVSNRKKESAVVKLIETLGKLANESSDYPYINHQREFYGNVPLWVLLNGVTFGTLSKFYALMTQDLRIKVSKNFSLVNEKQLEQYLSVITKFRNVCAHNERLYSYQTKNDIPDTSVHAELGIPKKGSQYICGKHDLFALVIAFRYLLPNDDFGKFKNSLNRIIRHFLRSQSFIPESELLGYMGFPNGWQKITRCK